MPTSDKLAFYPKCKLHNVINIQGWGLSKFLSVTLRSKLQLGTLSQVPLKKLLKIRAKVTSATDTEQMLEQSTNDPKNQG